MLLRFLGEGVEPISLYIALLPTALAHKPSWIICYMHNIFNYSDSILYIIVIYIMQRTVCSHLYSTVCTQCTPLSRFTGVLALYFITFIRHAYCRMSSQNSVSLSLFSDLHGAFYENISCVLWIPNWLISAALSLSEVHFLMKRLHFCWVENVSCFKGTVSQE